MKPMLLVIIGIINHKNYLGGYNIRRSNILPLGSLLKGIATSGHVDSSLLSAINTNTVPLQTGSNERQQPICGWRFHVLAGFSREFARRCFRTLNLKEVAVYCLDLLPIDSSLEAQFQRLGYLLVRKIYI